MSGLGLVYEPMFLFYRIITVETNLQAAKRLLQEAWAHGGLRKGFATPARWKCLVGAIYEL